MLDYMEKKRFSGEDSGSLRVRLHAATSRGGAIERPNEVDFARRPVGDLPSAHINLEVSVQAVKFDRIPNKLNMCLIVNTECLVWLLEKQK